MNKNMNYDIDPCMDFGNGLNDDGFFTLVNEICNLSPSLLIASRDPLLDNYSFD